MEIEKKQLWTAAQERFIKMKNDKIDTLLMDKILFEQRLSEMVEQVKNAVKLAERLEDEAMEREGYITQLNGTVESLQIQIAAREKADTGIIDRLEKEIEVKDSRIAELEALVEKQKVTFNFIDCKKPSFPPDIVVDEEASKRAANERLPKTGYEQVADNLKGVQQP